MISYSKRTLGTLFVLLAVCIILLPSVSLSMDNARFSSYIESTPMGRIDWDKGIIYGIGRGYLDVHGKSKPRALTAARVIASGNILKLAAGLRLDDRQKLADLGKGRVVIQLKAFLRIKEQEVKFVENVARPYYEVTRLTPISGVEGLTSKLLTQLRSTPFDWQDFPKRPGTTDLDDEEQPWLVLNASKFSKELKAQPALFPKIYSTTGETLYELKNVNETALVKRGMARYVVSSEDQEELSSETGATERILAQVRALFKIKEANAREKRKRKKRGKFIVKEVKQVQGLMKTNLVISKKDALELKGEDASTQILKKCRVIVVLSSPVGGIEGTIQRFLALAPEL